MTSSIIEAIDTRSNLDSKAFHDILAAVGFGTNAYSARSKLLDVRLVGNRNKIAHGEYLEIDASDYSELKEVVISVMSQFKDEIQNAASTGSYRRREADASRQLN